MTKNELLNEARARSGVILAPREDHGPDLPAKTQFKVGDRVQHLPLHGRVGWFATVARVRRWRVWLRDFSNGLPDADVTDEVTHWTSDAFIPAPRYEQCECSAYGRGADDVVSGTLCNDHRDDWHGLDDVEQKKNAADTFDALTAGLRALHAAPCAMAADDVEAKDIEEPAPAESHAARDVVQGKAPLASDAQTESECAPVCDDCGKGPAQWGVVACALGKRALCAYCLHRHDTTRIESGPGITPPPPPVVDEDGEVWATASGEWP